MLPCGLVDQQTLIIMFLMELTHLARPAWGQDVLHYSTVCVHWAMPVHGAEAKALGRSARGVLRQLGGPSCQQPHLAAGLRVQGHGCVDIQDWLHGLAGGL